MSEPSHVREETAQVPSGSAAPHASIWLRVKEHKVLQWSLAYLGAALALAHAQELLAHTYHWPELIERVVMGALIVGFPIAVALAWYHGHKELKRISAGEATVIALLLVIAAGLLIVLVRPNQEGGTPAAASAAGASATAVRVSQSVNVPTASVAVVPFANLTGDPGKEYFSDGMAEALIDSLTQVPNLKVPARTSSFAYKGRSTDVRRIAADLGVSTILEGSVRSAGDRIRVTAQLVDGQTGYHRWSRSYDRKFDDVFKLEDELAAAIVDVLRGNADSDHPSPAPRAPPTRDAQAYDLYLQARSIAKLGGPENMTRAVAILDEVVARDPEFARAFASRAITLTSSGLLGLPLPQARERAERDARHALALDPNLPEAHTALGQLDALGGNWLAAESELLAARTAAPNDPLIRTTHAALVLLPTGRILQARAEMLEAYRLAPADPLVLAQTAYVEAAWGGSLAHAVDLADLAVRLGSAQIGPIAVVRSIAATHDGRCTAPSGLPPLPPPLRAAGAADVLRRMCVAANKDPAAKADAREAMHQMLSKLDPKDAAAFWFILVPSLVGLDDIDTAYGLIDRVPQFGLNLSLLWSPQFRSFRRDPRFHIIAQRTNLIDYWMQYGPPDDCELRDRALSCH